MDAAMGDSDRRELIEKGQIEQPAHGGGGIEARLSGCLAERAREAVGCDHGCDGAGPEIENDEEIDGHKALQ